MAIGMLRLRIGSHGDQPYFVKNTVLSSSISFNQIRYTLFTVYNTNFTADNFVWKCDDPSRSKFG